MACLTHKNRLGGKYLSVWCMWALSMHVGVQLLSTHIQIQIKAMNECTGSLGPSTEESAGLLGG